MIEMIEKAGLKVSKKHENVGVHDYTLLECRSQQKGEQSD